MDLKKRLIIAQKFIDGASYNIYRKFVNSASINTISLYLNNIQSLIKKVLHNILLKLQN